MKIVKLVFAGLLIYACANISLAWMQYFKFKDAVRETSLFGSDRSVAELQNKVQEIAAENSVPLEEDGFSVHRDDRAHTYIDGSYTKQISLLPIYAYPWIFTFHTDTISVKATKF